jgi:hypothetical protein
MKAQELKTKVIAEMIAGGYNEETVNNLVSKHFEYAVRMYPTVKTICECISILH